MWGTIPNRTNYGIEVMRLEGEYTYSMDAKGRIAVPAKLRAELGDVIYVSKGPDKSLFVYAESNWLRIKERLASMPISKARKLQLTLFPSAKRFELDAQGRVLLPQNLRDHAELVREVVILGVVDRAEIWSETVWRRFETDELTPDNMLRAMDELGF